MDVDGKSPAIYGQTKGDLVYGSTDNKLGFQFVPTRQRCSDQASNEGIASNQSLVVSKNKHGYTIVWQPIKLLISIEWQWITAIDKNQSQQHGTSETAKPC